MRSNRICTHGIPAAVLLLLYLPWIDGCGARDARKTTIQRTIIALRAQADSWEAYNSDEARSYLAPAYRRTVALLENGGASVLPRMLSASLAQGYYDVSAGTTGLCYGFSWLALDDDVRGFYLRSEGKPDVEVYPAFSKEPQISNTAWMMTSGAVLANEEEREKVNMSYRGMAIVVDAGILAEKKVLVGLILANGQKTEPVPAYFRAGPPG